MSEEFFLSGRDSYPGSRSRKFLSASFDKGWMGRRHSQDADKVDREGEGRGK